MSNSFVPVSRRRSKAFVLPSSPSTTAGAEEEELVVTMMRKKPTMSSKESCNPSVYSCVWFFFGGGQCSMQFWGLFELSESRNNGSVGSPFALCVCGLVHLFVLLFLPWQERELPKLDLIKRIGRVGKLW